ncbi:hypothetical protein K402DRAFT_330308 [Aulographum hederae CBS 113979]|uniref:RecQ-mediated genome instability protein 1 n=1 Tax=Aulographum hederae CBS 113979 TaxID=1176131 RepID=A0A6G1H3N6_9PEZI|nr:hypothetical protein K402DRAFT_330308 [Aulographum hederae CBS 113979]
MPPPPPPPIPSPELLSTLQTALRTAHLPPTTTWLKTFLTSTRPSTPLPALIKTATFRLLTSDITQTLSAPSSHLFPKDLHGSAAAPASRILKGPITVMVLDIQDVGKSQWSQIEDLEAQARGESKKGHEMIRVPVELATTSTSTNPNPNPNPSSTSTAAVTTTGAGAATASSGPFKLHLTDAACTQTYAFTLSPVQGISAAMPIGTKMLIQNVEVPRGVLMLEERNCKVLGGKVEEMEKAWRAGRLGRLKAAVGVGEGDRGGGG